MTSKSTWLQRLQHATTTVSCYVIRNLLVSFHHWMNHNLAYYWVVVELAALSIHALDGRRQTRVTEFSTRDYIIDITKATDTAGCLRLSDVMSDKSRHEKKYWVCATRIARWKTVIRERGRELLFTSDNYDDDSYYCAIVIMAKWCSGSRLNDHGGLLITMYHRNRKSRSFWYDSRFLRYRYTVVFIGVFRRPRCFFTFGKVFKY